MINSRFLFLKIKQMSFLSAIDMIGYRDLDFYGYEMEWHAVRLITGKYMFASVWGMLAYRLYSVTLVWCIFSLIHGC